MKNFLLALFLMLAPVGAFALGRFSPSSFKRHPAWPLNVLPNLTGPYLPNDLSVNPKLLSKRSVAVLGTQNVAHVFDREFCGVVSFAKSVFRIFGKNVVRTHGYGWRTIAALTYAIERVILGRANKKMVGIYAARVVASMKGEQAVRYLRLEPFVRKSVGVDYVVASMPHHSVARLSFNTAPNPASVRWPDFGVEVEIAIRAAKFRAAEFALKIRETLHTRSQHALPRLYLGLGVS